MSWLFSQALVEEYSVANCSAGEPCAQLSVMPTQHKFWRNDKMMDVSNLSRFGLTCAVLTGTSGEALLTSFRAGFRARISVPQEKVQALWGGRSGLWKEMARIVGEVQPIFVFIENSPLLRTRGLNVVLKDLAQMGYNAKWGVVGAYQVGAYHKRDRIWIVANAVCPGRWIQQIARDKLKNSPDSFDDGEKESVADANSTRRQGFWDSTERGQEKHAMPSVSSGWPIEPDVGRVAHGVAARVDRLKSLGNGQVPRVAATAWRILTKVL